MAYSARPSRTRVASDLEIIYDPYGFDDDTSSVSSVAYSQSTRNHELKRTLKARHLAMISLGGVIGQGLFLGSGANLYLGGPLGALIAYAIVGFIVFWVAYSLGEMATYLPVSGSFTIFCRRFVDDSFGAAIGYNYWACWSIVVASELTALPMIMRFWTHALPDAAWSAIWLVILVIVNTLGTRVYGETEYWFSLIKILTVIIFIIVGCLVSGGLVGGEVYGFKYWSDPGALPNGAKGVIDCLILSVFSMQGTEIVGITAGEAGNPRKQVPRAIKNVFWRILIFYILAMFVMGMVIPYDDVHNLRTETPQPVQDEDGKGVLSPFTMVFEKGSLEEVGHIMNAIILITILSCGNSALYVSSRTLLALSQEGLAWHKLSYITKNGVPAYALGCTVLVSLVAFATFFIPGQALYTILTKLVGIAGLTTWFGISIAHYRFRRAFIAKNRNIDHLPMKAPLHPVGDIVGAIGCGVIILAAGYKYFSPADPVGLIGNYGGTILFILGFTITKIVTKSKLVPLKDIDLDTGRIDMMVFEGDDDDDVDEKEIGKVQQDRGAWYHLAWKRIVIAVT
ncbi:amino acid permease/ SLC12A domain-containing protein [Phascolomyces articulosus]|uniref:Amino acid permease/ SLC12A domain-containing protein n=1 Tax=Phascolomyces articulosus TaxID=60185 RepID=A0AAD5P850_9FUNG|nr:amino acid permease/ SLC12A domain-containing protein [Phascolomyces articulosus]